ncbi:MAG: histidine phosphatase family protein [Thermoplasmata archaeon]
MKYLKKGYWKPMFKFRYNDDYFDKSRREEYEKNLRTKLFSREYLSDGQKYDWKDIVITKNLYPYIFGDEVEQYIVWIKERDPGIKNIARIVGYLFPNYDYNIMMNMPEEQSIKSIIHYHVIIKKPSTSFCLKKLIVFHRHGNREPIFKFPIIEILRDLNFGLNPNAQLLPIGRKNSFQFGHDLRKIYNLDKTFLENSIYLTSPLSRCRETLENIIRGLGGNNTIIILEDLLTHIDSGLVEILDLPQLDSLYRNYKCSFDKIKRIFCIHPSTEDTWKSKFNFIYDIYNYYCSLQCYRDLGIDISQYIDESLESLFGKMAKKCYNFICHYNQIFSRKSIKRIITFTRKLNKKLVLCSTHDTLIFTLAKYYASKYHISFDLNLPNYLSNIRIEEWSDGVTRVFYDNQYMGDIKKIC